MEAHYGNITRKTCPSCGKTFFSTKGLYLHKKSVHERITFPCECGKDFKFLASLKSHKKAFHGVGIKEIHYCKICEKEFKGHSGLWRHKKRVHGGGDIQQIRKRGRPPKSSVSKTEFRVRQNSESSSENLNSVQ